MTTTDSVAPPRLDSTELQSIIDSIAHDARARRDGNDEHPFLALDLIRKHRLGAVRLPLEIGGGGYSCRDLFSLIIRLAEADPDVPHIVRVHFGFAEDRWRKAEVEAGLPWLDRVLEGKLFGGAATELAARPVGTYAYDTLLTPSGDGYRLSGTKYYSTGSMFSDYISVAANLPDGDQIYAVIPADRTGVVHADDWDGIGQRHTGSGTTVLDDVHVDPSELLPFARFDEIGRRRQSQPQLILHAIAAGILRSVTADATELIRSRRRTYTFGSAEEPRHDPQLLEIIGSLSAAAYATEATVLAAADAQDRAADATSSLGHADEELEHEASLLAAKTKVAVEDIALRAATELFNVGGAAAIRSTSHLDRHWRNLRTLFSHNPTVYKSRAIGDVVVNGVRLPNVGFF